MAPVDTAETHGARRRSSILATGLKLWRDDPTSVNASRIGKALGLTHSSVLYHFKTSDGLRSAVAEYAVAIGDKIVVPMLIVSKHPAAAALCDADRRRYLAGAGG